MTVFIEDEHKIEDLDLAARIQAREQPLRVLQPRQVVDELDSLKRHSNPKKRWSSIQPRLLGRAPRRG
jgi:hypothetical protein